jgi:hypothetical protein
MPLPPPPVAAPVTPTSALVTDLVAISPYAMNSDGDGLNSEFPIAVYLYAKPFPAPKWQAGSFTLNLYEPGEAPARGETNEKIIAKRSWTLEEALEVRNRSLVGDFYRFVFNLSDAEIRLGSSQFVEYRICFIPESGEPPVYSSIKAIRSR